jgi:hypothetical protein
MLKSVKQSTSSSALKLLFSFKLQYPSFGPDNGVTARSAPPHVDVVLNMVRLFCLQLASPCIIKKSQNIQEY